MNGSETTEYPVIWLQTAACTGCLVSLLNSVSPTARNVLVDEVLPGKHINMRCNPTVMAGAGELAIQIMERPPNRRREATFW